MPKDEKLRSQDNLGVDRNATTTEIRLAFFKKSILTHPDKSSEGDMVKFKEATQAYSILSGSSCDAYSPDQIFFNFFQEVLREDVHSLQAIGQEHDAPKYTDDEYTRDDEDDHEHSIDDFLRMFQDILRNRLRRGKDVPIDLTLEKVTRCRENLVRQGIEAKKDLKKQPPKKGKQQPVPVSKPKPKSKKQLLAEQKRRGKEMEKIALELEEKKKEDEEKEKIRKQMEAEKQKRLEEERKKSEAEARRQREREQKERERLQKLEQERERKQKEEEEWRKKEEMKRKKAEQERIEKEKAEKASKIKAAQQAAKEKEEQAKNMAANKNQNLKRNQPQRNDQLYPREIPPRFQRRMKQQQQQSVFPQQPSQPVSQPTSTAQQQTVALGQPPQTKAISKPIPAAVGKKKDPNRWTKGEYTGIIEDPKDDLGWSKAPPAKNQNWVDTTGSLSDWGTEATSWGEKSVNEERVIVDKTDQDSWPTVGGRGKGNTEQAVPGNIDTHSRKENWSSDVTTFGDSLDAAIDGMEAAEEAAGSWDSAKWSGSEGSLKDSGSNNSGDTKDLLDTKGNSQQSWSKTPGKGVKLKGSTANNKTENSSDSLSSSLDEGNSGGKESGSFDDEWKTVGKSSTKGTKNDPSPGPSPSEETGWGESSVGNRNSGSNWSASWSSQGLSLTGTEIWDEGNGEDKKNLNNDKGSDWLENSGDSKSAGDGGWEDVGGDDGGGDGWNRWTMASSKRNKGPKPNQVNDENAWLRRSLKQLVDMGFKEEDGEKALKYNNMSLEGAISQLLGQGAPSGHHSPVLPPNLVLQDQISETTVTSQTDSPDDLDISKLNRKQRRQLMQQQLYQQQLVQQQQQQTLAQDTEQYPNKTESLSFSGVSNLTNISVISSTTESVSESSADPLARPSSSERPLEDGKESLQIEPQRSNSTDAVDTSASLPSTIVSGSLPVRAPFPNVVQQQLLQQAQLQQLRLAQASGLMRNPLGSTPLLLIRQLSQLRLIQQQLGLQQQQLLQKQPQSNTIQSQQLALQQQQISVMMSQIQQQLMHQQLQQQQQQQQQQPPQQQQQLPSNRFTGPQQSALASQPQLQQLLLQQQQQRKQQQQLQQQSPLKQGLTRTNETDASSDRNDEELRGKSAQGQSISPNTSMATGKESASIAQVVNSAPASPSTGKSRLGQWTQASVQTERNTLSLKSTSDVRERNLRSSPQLDISEKSSLLITRSTNSSASLQSVTSSVPVHRVSDPVSSKWGIDAAPKLSAEPPEFKPGVPWRPHQAKDGSETTVSEGGPAKSEGQDWSSNAPASNSSSTYTNTNTTHVSAKPPNSTSPTLPVHAVWQPPVARPPAAVPRPVAVPPLPPHVRPPPGLSAENSFLNLPDVSQIRQSTDVTWLRPSVEPLRQMTSGQPMTSSQFPGAGVGSGPSPWASERVGRAEAGWPSSAGQPLETMPAAPPNVEIGLNCSVEAGNGGGLGTKQDLSSQSSAHAISTWLVLRNISSKVESTALRSLCQQHGPLLTFQLNLRYGNSLIRYGSKEEATKAHASLNGLPLGGNRITADFATDSDIGSFFEQTTDWSTPGVMPPITTNWAGAPTQNTESNTQWPGSKSLLPPTGFSSELWSFAQPGLGTNVSSVWSTPASSRREGEQAPTVSENGITSPSMVTFLPPGLLNGGESM